MNAKNFDQIRSFRDNEVNDYLQKIIKEDLFIEILSYQFGRDKVDEILNRISHIQSIKELQFDLLKPLLENLLKQSVSGLTYSGLENIQKDNTYLFISNHRDILLDPFILNYILMTNGYDTIESAIGNNLFVKPWIEYLARLNKSFIVHRDLEGKKFYYVSTDLSNYIKNTLLERKQSMWIAQQEGRSKDGNDKTQHSLIRMLLLSADKGQEIELLNNYNIVTVSLSYEYDPCVAYKILSNYQDKSKVILKKTDKFRLNEMKEGLIDFKGKIHFHFSKPMLFHPKNQNIRDFINDVCHAIDTEIHKNYVIYPFHWYCYDKINKSNKYIDKYIGQETTFIEYIDSQKRKIENIIGLQTSIIDSLVDNIYYFYAKIVSNFLKTQNI
ncbi:MAG: 1-acyl-sn-glycerol-3-phosphate acyltransferase [Bacteroidales bacterium]|nr:1-acyl-sn-glycerol-3-phosphate acyltransferase [Bacteroidales bacterium]